MASTTPDPLPSARPPDEPRSGTVSPFFDPEPPHWAARGLAYLLIGLFAVVLTGATLVRLPEAVSCPFVLLPIHGTDPVRATRSGEVGDVRILQAASVTAGAALFTIRSSDVGGRSAELHTLEAALHGDEQHVDNARREHASQTLADEQEARRLDQRLAYLAGAIERERNQVALTAQVVERYDMAYQKGFTSLVDYLSRRAEANRTAMELAQFITEQNETRTAQEKLRHEASARDAKFAETDRGLAEERERTGIRIAALRQELSHSVSDELTVPAPCAGTVLRLAVKAAGAYVHEGDVLCEIACSGERLQAELTIPESGVGRIKSGQGVKLLYDAFPYQRYGIKYGTVRWVSPSSNAAPEGRGFRTLADIESDSVQVDRQPRPLVAGMGGTARVVVGRRSIISAAFAPLRELQEAFADAADAAPHGNDRQRGHDD